MHFLISIQFSQIGNAEDIDKVEKQLIRYAKAE